MESKIPGIATSLVLGCLLAAGILASQPDAATSGAVFADSGQALGSSLSYATVGGDVDGDGDVDVVVTAVDGDGSVLWLNQGGLQGGSPGIFADSGQALGSSAQGVDLGDVDSDGDLDLMIGTFGGDRIWINQGGSQGGTEGSFLDSGQLLGFGSDAALALTLGDLDADGDLDAVVAAAPTASRVYTNQGGSQGGVEGIFLDSGQVLPPAISVAVGDLDSDGDPDCFAARAASDQVWLNDGAGAFATSQTLPVVTTSNDVALGDLDGDGDLDALVVSLAFDDLVWINQGGAQGGTAGVFADSGQTLGPSASRGVDLGDLDADGDLDAYVAAANGQPDRAWMNQGGAVFADSGQAIGSDPSVDVALAYLDGDGRLDAFVATLGPERVWLGLLGGAGTGFFEELATYMESYRIFGMAVADFDGDGALDVAATALALLDDDNASRLWLNLGDGSAELIEATPLPFRFPLAAGDVDGDGDVDLVGREPFITRITLNDGSGTFQESTETIAFDADGIELADVDGDGDLDALLWQEAADQLTVWINQGGNQAGTEGSFVASGQVLPNARPALEVTDLDGDGDPDLVLPVLTPPCSDGGPTCTRLGVFINQAGTFIDTGQRLGPESDGVDLDSGDLDLDGDADIVAFFGHPAHARMILTNNGAGVFSVASECGGRSTLSTHQVLVGRLDGDPTPDVVFAHTDPRVAVGLNLFFNRNGALELSRQCLGSSDNATAELADIDQDGDADLITGGRESSLGGGFTVWRNGLPQASEAQCCAIEATLAASERVFDPVDQTCDEAPTEPPPTPAGGWWRGAASALVDIVTYYRVRDELLPSREHGQRIRDLYAEHNAEVLALMLTDPTLLLEGLAALEMWQDNLGALIDGDGDSVVITPEEAGIVDAFLAGLESAGSPSLANAVTTERANLPPIPSFAGMTMDEAVTTTTGGPASIFGDGFESGDLSGWSSATGGLR